MTKTSSRGKENKTKNQQNTNTLQHCFLHHGCQSLTRFESTTGDTLDMALVVGEAINNDNERLSKPGLNKRPCDSALAMPMSIPFSHLHAPPIH